MRQRGYLREDRQNSVCQMELEILTPVNTFFQQEELQALPLDRVSDIRTPQSGNFDASILLLLRETCLFDLFIKEIQQASIRGNDVFVFVAIFKCLVYGRPHKFRDLCGRRVIVKFPSGVIDRLAPVPFMDRGI